VGDIIDKWDTHYFFFSLKISHSGRIEPTSDHNRFQGGFFADVASLPFVVQSGHVTSHIHHPVLDGPDGYSLALAIVTTSSNRGRWHTHGLQPHEISPVHYVVLAGDILWVTGYVP
jgi:hypothetical protein